MHRRQSSTRQRRWEFGGVALSRTASATPNVRSVGPSDSLARAGQSQALARGRKQGRSAGVGAHLALFGARHMLDVCKHVREEKRTTPARRIADCQFPFL
jgi:hypothetical protein